MAPPSSQDEALGRYEVAEPSVPPPELLYAVPEGTVCKAGRNDDVLSSDKQEELNEQAAQ